MDASDEAGQNNMPDAPAPAEFGVGQRVRVYPGDSNEQSGVIVEDFGQDAGNSVEIGDVHIADASRRWAIILDDGNLLFADSGDISQ